MSKISTVKGFADHLPGEAAQFGRIAETARRVFAAYGYKEVHIPILEYTELFARSIGTDTDVVQKEMFTFPDRKDRSLTLRPEATAGLMRSYIEHSIHAKEPVTKFFTHGPMFRYERPQKGRMRQFHQVDVECLGAPEPQVDAEMLLMLMDYLAALGLKDLTLEINTLGCKKCRPNYRETLTAFLRSLNAEELCDDCRQRMETNPLRVLDCKVPRCKELTAGAPQIYDHACPDCLDHFNTVINIIEAAGLKSKNDDTQAGQESGNHYLLSRRLVRGLDYYTRTTFEVVSNNIGAQGSVAGGGRYDGLIASLGGPEVSGIGFACGLERLALLLPECEPDKPDFYIAVLADAARNAALLLAQSLRKNGLSGETSYNAGSAKSQLRKAAASGARYCLLLGADEMLNGTVVVKNMENGEQVMRKRDDLNNLV